MTPLPIDPSAINPDDLGERQATLEISHEDALEYVRNGITDAGFKIVTEFSPSRIINENVGSDHDPYYVFGACSPSIADQALRKTWTFGSLLPCNIVVRKDRTNYQHVYQINTLKISRLLGLAPADSEWEQLVQEVETLSDELFIHLQNE